MVWSAAPALVCILLASLVDAQIPDLVWETASQNGYNYVGRLALCQNSITGTQGSPVYGFKDVSVPNSPCRSPGPTIRFTPGKNYYLQLTEDGVSSSVATNLHLHGIHLSGDANADNVKRKLSGTGFCLGYNYSIPDYHMGGTFWYHPHHHGTTNAQAGAGAYGLVVVSDQAASGGFNGFNAADLSQFRTFLARPEHAASCADSGCSAAQTWSWVANTWYRVRLAYANKQAAGMTWKVDVVGNCAVHELARDGLYRTLLPLPATTTYAFAVHTVSRLDLAIKCAPLATATIKNGVSGKLQTVATINVAASGSDGASIFADAGGSFNPAFPSYMASLMSATPGAYWGVKGFPIGMCTGNGCSTTACPSFTEGIAACLLPSTTEWYGQVVEINLIGSSAHPSHFHGYPMQLVSASVGTYVQGEWYDTFNVGATITVRMNMVNFGGKLMMHCHFLQHEDGGAMAYLTIGGPGTPGFPLPLPTTLEYTGSCPAY